MLLPLQALIGYIKGSLLVYISQGGVKVLITGPWQEASSEYTCLFDQITVPASLIQPGVLRCYCPGISARALIQTACTLHTHLNCAFGGKVWVCCISESQIKFKKISMPNQIIILNQHLLQAEKRKRKNFDLHVLSFNTVVH